MFASVSLLTLAVGFPAPPPAPASRYVVLKSPRQTAYLTDDGPAGASTSLSLYGYLVVRTDGPRTWLRYGPQEMWVPHDQTMTPAAAVKFYSDKIAAEPADVNHYVGRAKAYELLHDYEAGIKDYDEAVRLAPAVGSWRNNRANFYIKLREFDKAIADYDEALRLTPASFIMWSNRGNALSGKRDYAAAVESYDKAVEHNPAHANGYIGRAAARVQQKEYDLAMEDVEKGLRFEPKSAYGYSTRGQIFAARKDFDKAHADYRTAHKHDPSYAPAYYFRARGLPRAEGVVRGGAILRLGHRGVAALPGRVRPAGRVVEGLEGLPAGAARPGRGGQTRPEGGRRLQPTGVAAGDVPGRQVPRP